jgi:aspartate racemase
MKTIGLLGGMSWESTMLYYRAINEGVRKSLGGLHSGKIILHSVDFDPIEKLQRAGDWETAAKILVEAALGLQGAGADCLLICTNTMHMIFPEIERALAIPLLHIADATAEALLDDQVKTAALLGTAFTMEEAFYKGRLKEVFGLEILLPAKKDRAFIHRVIYEELCLGETSESSRREFSRIIGDLSRRGAEGVILGCTEIGALLGSESGPVKLYDTTALHAAKAVAYALS